MSISVEMGVASPVVPGVSKLDIDATKQLILEEVVFAERIGGEAHTSARYFRIPHYGYFQVWCLRQPFIE